MDDAQKVNLFILGAAKSGTTSLVYVLGQHPDICISRPKEPFFFEAEYEKGIQFYKKKYFSHWKGEKVFCDARHRNLCLPYVPARIKSCYPNAKFIVLLRNPLERIHSHWWHWYSRGIEKRSFSEVVEMDLKRLIYGPFFRTNEDIDEYVRTFDFSTGYSLNEPYVEYGHYAEQIERYREFFGNEAVKVFFLAQIREDPFTVMDNIFSCLGLSVLEKIDVRPQNVALSISRLRFLQYLRNFRLRVFVPDWARAKISYLVRHRDPGVRQIKPPMDEATRTTLLIHYKPHIRKLEKIVERNLDAWYRGEEISCV